MRAFGLVFSNLLINLGKNRAIASPQTIAPGTTVSIIALFIFKSPSISFYASILVNLEQLIKCF